MSDVTPYEIVAALLADTVDTEDAEGRIHLIGGGVRAIMTAELPATHLRLGVLLAIRTDGGSPAPLEMTVVHIDAEGDERELLRGDLIPVGQGAGTIVWVGFNLPPLQLTLTGEHRIEFRGVGPNSYAVSFDVSRRSVDGEDEADAPRFRPVSLPGSNETN